MHCLQLIVRVKVLYAVCVLLRSYFVQPVAFTRIYLSLFDIHMVQKIEMRLLLADPMNVMGDVST